MTKRELLCAEELGSATDSITRPFGAHTHKRGEVPTPPRNRRGRGRRRYPRPGKEPARAAEPTGAYSPQVCHRAHAPFVAREHAASLATPFSSEQHGGMPQNTTPMTMRAESSRQAELDF